MNILFDHQIFTIQKFGGISRYFNEIMKIENEHIFIQNIDPSLFEQTRLEEPKTDLFSRGLRYAKRKIVKNQTILKETVPESVKIKLRGNDFDIFHPTYYDPYFLEYVKKPFVLTVYDMIHEIYREYFYLNDKTSLQKRLLCNKAEQIIAISNTTKNDLVDIFKIDKDKVHAIQLASNFSEIDASQPEHIEGIENYILFTGSRAGYKNFYFTLLALRDILLQDNKLQLLCTGHSFSNEELEMFSSLGLATQVKHVYLKDDRELAWAYKNAKVFVFPSLYEGFGFPLLEAFNTGCPVVSSNTGSLPEVGGDAPIYINPKNISQIQDAVCSALYDQVSRTGMINKGHEQAAKFSWDDCRAKTIDVYKSVSRAS